MALVWACPLSMLLHTSLNIHLRFYFHRFWRMTQTQTPRSIPSLHLFLAVFIFKSVFYVFSSPWMLYSLSFWNISHGMPQFSDDSKLYGLSLFGGPLHDSHFYPRNAISLSINSNVHTRNHALHAGMLRVNSHFSSFLNFLPKKTQKYIPLTLFTNFLSVNAPENT